MSFELHVDFIIFAVYVGARDSAADKGSDYRFLSLDEAFVCTRWRTRAMFNQKSASSEKSVDLCDAAVAICGCAYPPPPEVASSARRGSIHAFGFFTL